jgi:hypothetical protein
MYIKINKRIGRYHDSLQFSVIESFRDGKKVRHRTLAYLAAIHKDALKKVRRLESFWKNCDEKLSAFPEADRTRLAARVETIVPRPSEEIAEQARKEELERMKDFAAYMRQRGLDPRVGQ